MRLTRADGKVLLGAISAELESQRWRQMKRDDYDPRLSPEIEQHLRDDDRARAELLCRVRDKITSQMEPRARPRG